MVKVWRGLTENKETSSGPDAPSHRGDQSPGKVTIKGTVKIASQPGTIAKMIIECIAQPQPSEDSVPTHNRPTTVPDKMHSRLRRETTKVTSGSRFDIDIVEIITRRKLAVSQFPNKNLDTRSNPKFPDEASTIPGSSKRTIKIKMLIDCCHSGGFRRNRAPDPFIRGHIIKDCIV